MVNEGVTQSDLVDEAIRAMLMKTPPRWRSLNIDALTHTEQEAIGELTAAGLIERRISFRLGMVGHSATIEATVTATGEFGLVEAAEPVLKTAWETWADDYRRRKGLPAEEQPCFHCERAGQEEVRLTDQGQLARKDLLGGNERAPLDFVRRRTAVFSNRPPVRGCGRAEKIHTIEASLKAQLVEVTNLEQISEPLKGLATALARFMEQQLASTENALKDSGQPPTKSGGTTIATKQTSPAPNWSKPCSKTEAAACLGISTDNLNDYLADTPQAVHKLTRQKWQFDRNYPLFKSLP